MPTPCAWRVTRPTPLLICAPAHTTYAWRKSASPKSTSTRCANTRAWRCKAPAKAPPGQGAALARLDPVGDALHHFFFLAVEAVVGPLVTGVTTVLAALEGEECFAWACTQLVHQRRGGAEGAVFTAIF